MRTARRTYLRSTFGRPFIEFQVELEPLTGFEPSETAPPNARIFPEVQVPFFINTNHCFAVVRNRHDSMFVRLEELFPSCLQAAVSVRNKGEWERTELSKAAGTKDGVRKPHLFSTAIPHARQQQHLALAQPPQGLRSLPRQHRRAVPVLWSQQLLGTRLEILGGGAC